MTTPVEVPMDIAEEKTFSCNKCTRSFKRRYHLKRHEQIHSRKPVQHNCNQCEETFTRKRDLMCHTRTCHPIKRKLLQQDSETFSKRPRQSDRVDALNVFTVIPFPSSEENEMDFLKFFEEIREYLTLELKYQLLEKHAFKWYAVVRATLSRTTQDGDMDFVTPHFRSKVFIELNEDTITEHIEEGFKKIIKSFEEYTQQGSGWVLEKIEKLELNLTKYHPLAASSYIPLPKKITDKKAVLNIQNKDQKCFIWCLIAHKLNIDYTRKPERVSHYTPYEDDILLGNVSCPVPVCKVPIIEKLNDLRINVFGLDGEEVCPLYISSKECKDVINLLMISDEKRQHYTLIRNFSRLLGDRTKHKAAYFYCYRCLHGFTKEELLKEHVLLCNQHEIQKIKMPLKEDCILKFNNVHMQHDLPYVVYADFESLIVPVSTTFPNPNQSFTFRTAHHVPCGYAFIIVGPSGKAIKPVQHYRGVNAVQHFLETLIEETEGLADKMYSVKPLILTENEEKAFQAATTCFLCHKPLGQDRVRDHDHLDGHYRGALHQKCNLQFRLRKMIPVIFHNLKNYDAHLIMQGIGKFKNHQIEVIASNMEKYISFSMNNKYDTHKISLRFIDSLQFMSTSLEKLVKNLSPDKFNILKETFPTNTDLLLRKGIYPYEYVTDYSKFDETMLPCKEAFYSTLSEEPISDTEYQHAQNIWKTFNIENLGQYHDLYVKTDVLLLADVFQNFREVCKRNYDLDCTHLFTSPGLAWQACLKMSEQPLELLTDINMHLFIEQGIRGGVSMISQRLAIANNKYLKNYNSSEASRYIMYWDANNLYGWAMSQYMPYGGFCWVDASQFDREIILNLKPDASTGYIFEVDLQYPKDLHDMHNDYPLAPEHLEISKDMLSAYNSNFLDSDHYKSHKLVPNLLDKKKYIVHYRNLQLYLTLGMHLDKVHRVLKFYQKPWLNKYIAFNTEQRKNASSTFEKDFFKLMNNSVFGKTMENVRNRKNIQLVNDSKKAEKLTVMPTFKAFCIFNENLVGIERIKKTLTLNRPIYVGFAILELSKFFMYQFHYNFVKRKYGLKAQLLFTDTDSLTYEIETDDVYQDMKENLELFDTSDYPKDHPMFSERNKKIIGKFKDEMNSKPILEFVGLRSKMYSLKTSDSEKIAAKGVSKTVIKKRLKHDNYKECLLNSTTIRALQKRIHSEKHQLYSVTQNKIALSPFDDKRFISQDGVHSLAYGHKDQEGEYKII